MKSGSNLKRKNTPLPGPGQIAYVRQRRYLVEKVSEPTRPYEASLVEMSCLDDDAQGEPLSVLWEHELDARVLQDDGWSAVAKKGFDDPALFAAYLRTLSWNCVTAADPNLFQSPFRAGIRLDAYQLEPLRKALRLPRVNLFIADDVGLGKTIEAGLIARELLLRRRVDRIVVVCPPSMLEQWRDEMETRFGLTFKILDRSYVTHMRRERGFSVNPWTTHSRFLISHRLLIDEAYASGLRDWLGEFAPQTLMIFDEAHNAAPSSGIRYAIDSQTTRAVRDIAPRFEHRLFLSATPHNGHSNSFSALLEILDPQRFCRGVNVLKGQLEDVMIRRLKSDIRALEGGFPKRTVVQIDISGLPPDSPELILSEKLDAYRLEQEKRLAGEARSHQTAGSLVIGCLQKRLLSSIDAFSKTLSVHRKTVVRMISEEGSAEEISQDRMADFEQMTTGMDFDVVEIEDNPEEDESQVDRTEQELYERMEKATEASSDASQIGKKEALQSELALVDEMQEIAEASRFDPDPRIYKIIEWIDEHLCPGLLVEDGSSPKWNNHRVLIFTEYEDTRRYLETCLREAIAHTDQAEDRIAIFTGITTIQKREEIKHAFNTEPNNHPLRILIATDAAREGLNLQRHCHNLFHYDLPWNPSRLDQRNGRIDRKLQPADEVFCHYFVYLQRPEDRVLKVLVEKADRIREELGSVAKILEGRISKSIGKEGMCRNRLDELAGYIQNVTADDQQAIAEQELEDARLRQEDLKVEVDRLRSRLDRSKKQIGVSSRQLRKTLSMSLRLSGAPGIAEVDPNKDRDQDIPRTFKFPAFHDALARDTGWTAALDTLRNRRKQRETLGEWRRRSSFRPVVFEHAGSLGENAVQLHLEHRVAQRLLGRFTAQGLIHHDLSKACLTTTAEAFPRVILLGRFALYGAGASRLHEEIVPVTARWIDPDRRNGSLLPFGQTGEETTLMALQTALDEAGQHSITNQVQDRLTASTHVDIKDLLPYLERRAEELLRHVVIRLNERAEVESRTLIKLLEDQRRRISAKVNTESTQMRFNYSPDERRQYEAERRQQEADRRAWARRLERIETELETEPRRIAATYKVHTQRVEPLGLVYLWPRTG